MTDPVNNLLEHPCLATLSGLLPSFPQVGKLYLVGGSIRDALLGHSPADFDFTAEHDPTPLARALAKQCGGHWFWLDEQRRQSRVGIGEGTFDFAPWRASTLTGDLAARDFTINAMAIDLLVDDGLIDPLGGRDDLSGKILRCAGPDVLQEDPLRVLKGIRHAVELELAIDPATLNAMQSTASRLTDTAPERLRLEFWRILAAPAACRGMEWLIECGASKVLFGSNYAAGLEMAQHALRRTTALFELLAADSRVASDWLLEPVEQGLDRRMLQLWCRTFGVINPEQPLILAHSWRFSRIALSRIAALRNLSPQHWRELLNLPRRPRPIALWALQYGPDPIDLLLALGALGNDEPDAVRNLLAPILDLVAELPDAKRVPPLVDGSWLKMELGVEGAELGAIHENLRHAEISGVVSNVDEARQYLVHRFPKRC